MLPSASTESVRNTHTNAPNAIEPSTTCHGDHFENVSSVWVGLTAQRIGFQLRGPPPQPSRSNSERQPNAGSSRVQKQGKGSPEPHQLQTFIEWLVCEYCEHFERLQQQVVRNCY